MLITVRVKITRRFKKHPCFLKYNFAKSSSRSKKQYTFFCTPQTKRIKVPFALGDETKKTKARLFCLIENFWRDRQNQQHGKKHRNLLAHKLYGSVVVFFSFNFSVRIRINRAVCQRVSFPLFNRTLCCFVRSIMMEIHPSFMLMGFSPK